MSMIDGSSDPPDRPGLGESLRVLRRRWRMAALVLVATVGLSVAYSLASDPVYTAYADVLIEPSGADVQSSTGTKISAEEVATQTQVVTSLPVARLVQKQNSLPKAPDLADLVTVQAVGTSRIMRVSAQAGSPEEAAANANTVASSYLEFREQDSVARYEEAKKRLLQEQTDLEDELRKVNALLVGARASSPLQVERRTILTSMAQVSSQLDALSQGLTTSAAGGQLLRSAAPDDRPTSPQTTLNVLLGVLAGIVLGVGAALLRDRVDDVVHEEESASQAMDAVILARVPHWSERSLRDRLVTLHEPHAPASEEYQRLAVNVRFMLATSPRDHGSALLVTAGREGEGKTVTASNLAVAAARLGLRVTLVDADFRRGSVGQRFGLGDAPGLSDVLVGEVSAGDHLVDVGVPRLQVLAAGTPPPNPAALLSSDRMRSVLSELTAEADLVVIDSAPMLTGADTLELVGLADMVLVVVRERMSRRRQLASVREALRHVGAPAVGLVYNGTADLSLVSYPYPTRPRDVDGRSTTAATDDAGAAAAVDGPPAPGPAVQRDTLAAGTGDEESAEGARTRDPDVSVADVDGADVDGADADGEDADRAAVNGVGPSTDEEQVLADASKRATKSRKPRSPRSSRR